MSPKADQGVYDYACQAGGTMTESSGGAHVGEPVRSPSAGRLVCFGLTTTGNTSRPCVSREEYDRTELGAFWHGQRTAQPPTAGIVLVSLASAMALAAATRPRPQTGAGRRHTHAVGLHRRA